MEELVKKINEINGKLIEIKDKVDDRSTFNIFGGEGHVNNVNDGGIGIQNQKNYFLIFQFDWIFKKFKNENLNWKQFIFLFFSRMILIVLSVAAFLLPLFSVNKHNISFYEFSGMIIVFIFLCSWLWSKIKTQEE